MKKSSSLLAVSALSLALALPASAAGTASPAPASPAPASYSSPAAVPGTMASPGTTSYTTNGNPSMFGTNGTNTTYGTNSATASPNAHLGASRGYGTDGMTNRYHLNSYRTNAATTTNNNANWGWLGLLGLIGLFGMRSRNDRRHEAK